MYYFFYVFFFLVSLCFEDSPILLERRTEHCCCIKRVSKPRVKAHFSLFVNGCVSVRVCVRACVMIDELACILRFILSQKMPKSMALKGFQFLFVFVFVLVFCFIFLSRST